jgi:hypothetical protein
VQRQLPGGVLGPADRQPPLVQVDVVAVQRDRLADPHPGRRQQPQQGHVDARSVARSVPVTSSRASISAAL